MKPSDMSFRGEEGVPLWLRTCIRQLRDGGASAPPDVLSPVPFLQEVIALTESMAAGHGAPFAEDRASLREDLLVSLNSLGPASRRLHATAINDFRKVIKRLALLLDDLAGSQVLRGAASVLLDELSSPLSRVAALDDCFLAFRDRERVGICETRILYLKSIVELSGDWDDLNRRLMDALIGSDEAIRRLGALSPPHSGALHFHDECELDLEERLCLARRTLVAKVAARPYFFWLCYANAVLDMPWYLQKGPLEFFDSRIWADVVAGNHPASPPELQDEMADIYLRNLPEHDFVLVRVSLEHTVAGRASERAADLARAALELTGWETSWSLWTGSLAFRRLAGLDRWGFTSLARLTIQEILTLIR